MPHLLFFVSIIITITKLLRFIQVDTARESVLAVLKAKNIKSVLDPIVYSELKHAFSSCDKLSRRFLGRKADAETVEAVFGLEDILSRVLEYNTNPEVLLVSKDFSRAVINMASVSVGFILSCTDFTATPLLQANLKALIPLSAKSPMLSFDLFSPSAAINLKPVTLLNTWFHAYYKLLKHPGMSAADPTHRELTEAVRNTMLNDVRACRLGRGVVVAESNTGISIQ